MDFSPSTSFSRPDPYPAPHSFTRFPDLGSMVPGDHAEYDGLERPCEAVRRQSFGRTFEHCELYVRPRPHCMMSPSTHFPLLPAFASHTHFTSRQSGFW